MNVLSLFTGVGGFDLGLERAGHTIVGQVEWDKKCQAILRKHWPEVPLWDDVSTFDAEWLRGVGIFRRDGGEGRGYWVSEGRDTNDKDNGERGKCDSDRVDLVCGGFPCQDLSVAGRRAGLAGERSGLFHEAVRIADAVLEPGGWVLIENVPGLLSSNGGRDFGIVLASLAERGFYDLAWRVLDSRYFGVPQRRRRVFILGRRASGRYAAQVLLDPEGGGGDFEAGRQAGKAASPRTGDGVAKCLTTSQERLDAETQDFIVGPPSDPNGVRTPPRIPRRVDDPVTCPVDPRPDGPRYAQMGNAVTVPVAEWIGHRLREFA